MNTKHFFLLLLILFGSPTLGYSRNDLYFRHIDSSDGLSDNQVRGILSASDGRILVRTVGMINFYDATTFKYSRYNADKTYKWNYSSSEFEYIDQDERIWMKENGQLLLFDLKTNRFVYNIAEILSNYGIGETLKDVFLDNERNYWFLTQSNKLYYCVAHSAKSLLVSDLSTQDARFNRVLCLTQSGQNVFILYQSGLIRLFDTKKERFSTTLDFLKNRVHSGTLRYMMKRDSEGSVWVMFNGREGGLFKYEPKTSKWETFLKPGDFYTFFDIDRQGTVWVGTRDGL
ncbi:MAG TPA: hypothetical protein VIK20_02465, partial [Bacteroidales bacterium]